jgi:hypothetical protein
MSLEASRGTFRNVSEVTRQAPRAGQRAFLGKGQGTGKKPTGQVVSDRNTHMSSLTPDPTGTSTDFLLRSFQETGKS